MPSSKPPRLILGCANFGSPSDPLTKFHTPDQAADLIKPFVSFGHNTLDTSRRYPPTAQGTSEELIGETLSLLSTDTSSSHDIHIDTKVLSNPGDHKPSNIAASIAASLAALKLSSVRTIYLHFPDRSVPLTDPISALSNAVSSGQAKQWGLSNYTLEDLHEILALCTQNNWTKPAVFQGEYNALNRAAEPIIKLCHENNISFTAYSPAAAGVFSPTGTRLTAQNLAGQRVRQLYGDERTQSAVQKVRNVAEKKGLGGHEVAIRWVYWDSLLNESDGVIIGASSERQVRETCEFLRKGGLDEEVRAAVEGVWETVKK